jgi:hypothetical protein
MPIYNIKKSFAASHCINIFLKNSSASSSFPFPKPIKAKHHPCLEQHVRERATIMLYDQ